VHSYEESFYVQDGELDRELLAMTSEQVWYKDMPTLLEGKYLYATDEDEIVGILTPAVLRPVDAELHQ